MKKWLISIPLALVSSATIAGIAACSKTGEAKPVETYQHPKLMEAEQIVNQYWKYWTDNNQTTSKKYFLPSEIKFMINEGLLDSGKYAFHIYDNNQERDINKNHNYYEPFYSMLEPDWRQSEQNKNSKKSIDHLAEILGVKNLRTPNTFKIQKYEWNSQEQGLSYEDFQKLPIEQRIAYPTEITDVKIFDYFILPWWVDDPDYSLFDQYKQDNSFKITNFNDDNGTITVSISFKTPPYNPQHKDFFEAEEYPQVTFSKEFVISGFATKTFANKPENKILFARKDEYSEDTNIWPTAEQDNQEFWEKIAFLYGNQNYTKFELPKLKTAFKDQTGVDPDKTWTRMRYLDWWHQIIADFANKKAIAWQYSVTDNKHIDWAEDLSFKGRDAKHRFVNNKNNEFKQRPLELLDLYEYTTKLVTFDNGHSQMEQGLFLKDDKNYQLAKDIFNSDHYRLWPKHSTNPNYEVDWWDNGTVIYKYKKSFQRTGEYSKNKQKWDNNMQLWAKIGAQWFGDTSKYVNHNLDQTNSIAWETDGDWITKYTIQKSTFYLVGIDEVAKIE